MAALAHRVAPDEIVKNSFANFAFENHEIAAYRSLLTLADMAGTSEARGLLQFNLDEEVAMADWIAGRLDLLTRQFATLSASGEEVKTQWPGPGPRPETDKIITDRAQGGFEERILGRSPVASIVRLAAFVLMFFLVGGTALHFLMQSSRATLRGSRR